MGQLKAITTVVIILALVAVFWVMNDSPSKEVSSISIAVSRTPLSAPVYIAASLGYFSSEAMTEYLQEEKTRRQY